MRRKTHCYFKRGNSQMSGKSFSIVLLFFFYLFYEMLLKYLFFDLILSEQKTLFILFAYTILDVTNYDVRWSLAFFFSSWIFFALIFFKRLLRYFVLKKCRDEDLKKNWKWFLLCYVQKFYNKSFYCQKYKLFVRSLVFISGIL